jgi:hypothetical protein
MAQKQDVERGEQAAVYNAAQQEREAADHSVKKLADTANVQGGETWGNASGHSGTRLAWLASFGVIVGFLIGGIGLTVGPHLLIWIGAALAVGVGALGLFTHVWSDYRAEAVLEEEREESEASR